MVKSVKKSKTGRIVAVFAALVPVLGFFYFDLDQYLTFEYLKSQRKELLSFYQQNTALVSLLFVAFYILVTALSLPGAVIMTLAGGAIFGVLRGTILVSFASTIGATLAFIASRFVLRSSVERKFKSKLKAINSGIEKEGALYLFSLRLIPAVPFFVVNLVMGLTSLPIKTFFWVSQLGMLPGTVVYVNAGTQLGKLESLGEILSPALIFSFVLLGLFPIAIKKIMNMVHAKKIYKDFKKPKKFDYNIIAIGAGAGGLVTSYIGAAVNAKVALIEKSKMGGDCLNYGCIPSKALIKSAKVVHFEKRAEEFGLDKIDVQYNFAKVMERIQRVIKTVEPHDSVERYTELGVDCIQGEATIKSPYEVHVNGKTLTTRSIVIATGAAPFVPPIEGLQEVGYYTSDTIWDIRERPERLVVLGGGPIGSELAQAFSRLGCDVTQIERSANILSREDSCAAELMTKLFREEGVNILSEHDAVRCHKEGQKKFIVCRDKHSGEEKHVEFDALLIAVGRAARSTGYGLEELGVELTDRKTIQVNECLQTNYPNIYACGDIAGPFQFTHFAAYQAWFCAVNSLFGMFKKFKVDYRVIPRCTYTDPEVAAVGLNEAMAKQEGVEYEVSYYPLDDLDLAIDEDETQGYVKVLTVPKKDKILGVTIVGHQAGDYLVEFVTAMKYKLGLNKILGTIHAYPTFAEANKYVAGVWKNNNKPQWALSILKKYHAWWRG